MAGEAADNLQPVVLSIAVLCAPAAAVVVSSGLLFFRLYRSTDRFRYLWTALWRGKRHMFIFVTCEATYAMFAAVGAASVGLTRPRFITEAIAAHPLRGWAVFGAVMSIFGARVIAGALERLFPGVDGDGTVATERLLSRLHVVASARDRSLTALMHKYFEEADGQRQADDRKLRAIVMRNIDNGSLDLNDIHESYIKLCEYEDKTADPYLIRLHKDWQFRSRRGEVGAVGMVRTYVQYSISSRQHSALRGALRGAVSVGEG